MMMMMMMSTYLRTRRHIHTYIHTYTDVRPGELSILQSTSRCKCPSRQVGR